MSVTTTVTMTASTIFMSIPAAVIAIIVPMVAIFFIAAVAYNYLVSATFISYISIPVNNIASPRAWFIYYNLVAMINIIVAVGNRQIGMPYPNAVG